MDVCSSKSLSNEICSLAMKYTNYFFVKKCYLHYDKLKLACSAILLAAKANSVQNKLDDICNFYVTIEHKIKNNAKVLEQKDTKKLKTEISNYERHLLKALNYNVDVNLPFDCIYIYASLLYPNNEQSIINYAVKICNDSFFTYANNLYKDYVVALASINIAAKLLGIPCFFDKEFQNINNMRRINTEGISEKEFSLKLVSFKNSDKEPIMETEGDYFEKYNIYQKLHPFLVEEDLERCTNLIVQFYDEMKAIMDDNAKRFKK